MCVDQYFTPKEVQRLLKISERTLERWVNEGHIEATQLPTGGAFGQPATRFSASQIHSVITVKKPKRAIKNNDATN